MGVVDLNLDDIKKVLRYNPKTGHFTWKVLRRGVVREVAGSVDSDGYRKITVLGKKITAHRLAILFDTGEIPPKNMHVDHINGDRDDNRIKNLRVCTPEQNSRNSHKKTKKGSFRGVSFRKDCGKYVAGIRVNGKRMHLGFFDNKTDAARAYDKSAVKYHGEFATINF